jgi:serine/threonine protein kinase
MLRGDYIITNRNPTEMHMLDYILSLVGCPDQTRVCGKFLVSGFEMRVENLRSKIKVELSDTCFDLLSRCMVFVGEHRITAYEALRHGFFLDIVEDMKARYPEEHVRLSL